MIMIEIAPLSNGAHRNQTALSTIPSGWAVIPADMVCENFPFGEVTAEETGGVMTVTEWKPLPIPEPEQHEPTSEEQIAELKKKLSDTDYQAIKYAEGWITEEEYAPIKAQRQEWRDAINALEIGGEVSGE